MLLSITRCNEYKNKVLAQSIHGKYPYKLYLKIKGNSNYGNYIVVISDKQLNKEGKIDEISVNIENTKLKQRNNADGPVIVKPNMTTDGYTIKYKVDEVTVLDVGDTPLVVFNAVEKKGLKGLFQI